MDSLEQTELQKANEASARLIRESYNQIVLIHRHIWIACD